MTLPTLLDSNQVAQLLNVSKKTLANWRYQQRIPFIKVNGVVRYDLDTISNWLKTNNMEAPKGS